MDNNNNPNYQQFSEMHQQEQNQPQNPDTMAGGNNGPQRVNEADDVEVPL